MTGRERLLCALNHEIPDTVPIFESIYSRPFFKEVLGYDVDSYNAYDLMKCSEKVGYDFIIVPFGGLNGFGKDRLTATTNRYQDEWGVTYQKDPAAWPTDAPVEFPLEDRNDWNNYDFPDASAPGRVDEVNTALRLAKENGMGVMCNVRGPYTGAWMLFGIENFSYLFYDDPDLVHEILQKCTDFSITGAKRALEAGVDAIMFADDYGSCSAPLLSPALHKEFIVPQLKRLADVVHSYGKKLIMHSDGNIRTLLDPIFEAGIDGYHPIERAANMDIAEIKRTYGDRITLAGNINNKTTLVTGTPEDVAEEVRETIRVAAPGGGFIVTSDHSIHDDTPNENVFAMIEATRKYGKYPLSF
ncbi:MAG: uroporphyrinogen decarboxylase family protein [Eubacteriales bacterium]|jgi:uroporphyrinogen decarboxylase